jgi:uncharacterized protein
MNANEHSSDLMSYRINEAYEMIQDAELLLNNNSLRSSVNRIYYSLYYMISALAAKYEFETSNHKELIEWFVNNFAEVNEVDSVLGKQIKYAYKSRMKADNEAFIDIPVETVTGMYESALKFLEQIENYINTEQ